MRQVAFAVPGREQRPRRGSIREALGKGAALAPRLTPLQRDSRLSEPLWRKCPFPTPILTGCQQPKDAVLSLVQGVPEDAGRKSKMPPSPEARKQMTINSTLAPS